MNSPRYFSIPDLAIMLLAATVIYGMVAIGLEWRSEFSPVTTIDLSVWALPYYTLLSAIRGTAAYVLSLIFTLVVGYAAAKSKASERMIIPMLDIFQSIPILGFLPGLVMGLVALFPRTHTGLELAALLMIFTSQVWNMTFSYYYSLKSIPKDFTEAATMIGLSNRHRWLRVELPFAAVNLAWNSLLSMAGGWFFLIPCEAIQLGDKEYLLPGIGSYMDVAIKQNNPTAITAAVIAMVSLIVLMDFVIWRPILAWVRRFRLEEVPGIASAEPLMQIWIRESKILRWVKLIYRDALYALKKNPRRLFTFIAWRKILRTFLGPRFLEGCRAIGHYVAGGYNWITPKVTGPRTLQFYKIVSVTIIFIGVGNGASQLLHVLLKISLATWILLLRDAIWTWLRVVMALFFSTLWAVPLGIWLGTSSRRIRIAQPIIQVCASFPAPMLYPLALSVLFGLGISFDWGAMVLMLLGVQWYVLFNVLAGALRIPQELNDALYLMEASRIDRWKKLYLPSIFPSLVTGWITAAGGAWNASVVAEYIFYHGEILKTGGLGAILNVATAGEDFTLFAGSLTLMVVIVVMFNRLVWSRVHLLAQTRYRMDV